MATTRRLKVLVWHVHGTYLNLLVRAPHDFYLPVRPGRPEGYGGRGHTFQWPPNAIEVPAEEVKHLPLDVVIYQSVRNYFEDRFQVLSPEQLHLPGIYLEHSTPEMHPVDTRHPVADEDNLLLVHVTHFNNLMWDSGRCPTVVIEHAALPRPHISYTGEIPRGITAVNNIQRRRRIAGLDVFLKMRESVPLDLAGMNTSHLGGLGDIPHEELIALEARYRFFFNPIRYTSLPLAVVEAMSIGMPIVALATTELPTVVRDGEAGYVSCKLEVLSEAMRFLLRDRGEAERLGRNAQRIARERFNIERFIRDWDAVLRQVAS